MFLLRAFSSNLRTIAIAAGEQGKLAEQAIADPTVQRYLVWRRSVLLVILLVTLCSAAAGTVQEMLPGPGGHPLLERLGEALEFNFSEDEAETEGPPRQTTFGLIAEMIHTGADYAMPVAALAAFLCWSRPRFSRRLLLAGWCLAFLVPMLIALCPWSWWSEPSQLNTAAQRFKRVAEGIEEGALYLVALLPTVLSLIPGVQRACLRIKTLLPEAMLPGWFLVSAAPFSALLLMVVFVAVNQVASNPLFLAGMLLWIAAPLVYLVRGEVITRPLTSEADLRQLQTVRLVVGALTTSAGALLVAYFLSQSLHGIRLVGLDRQSALLHPIDLAAYLLEFLARSLFMTAVGADLVMAMNLMAWRQQKVFAKEAGAESYDHTMTELERATSSARV